VGVANIVLPSTMSVERDDIDAGSTDSTLFAMPQLAEPYAQARDDYATFAALADRLQVAEAFTEGPDRGPVAASPRVWPFLLILKEP
jgi:biotin/methionine sulfoxide reductase